MISFICPVSPCHVAQARCRHVRDLQQFVALGFAQPLQDLFASHQLFTWKSIPGRQQDLRRDHTIWVKSTDAGIDWDVHEGIMTSAEQSGLVVSLVIWGRSVWGCQKVLGKVNQGSTTVTPRFHQHCASFAWSLWFCGAAKVHQGFTKVSSRFQKGFTKVAPVSRCLWSSGAGPSWAAKRFHQGSAKVSPRFH